MNFYFIFIGILCVLSFEDHYATLGLKRGASLDTVKKRFRKLSLLFHPDKNSSPDAEKQYKLITHAYQQITDHQDNDQDQFNYGDRNRQYQQHNQQHYHHRDDEFRRQYEEQFYRKYENANQSERTSIGTFFVVGFIILCGAQFLVKMIIKLDLVPNKQYTAHQTNQEPKRQQPKQESKTEEPSQDEKSSIFNRRVVEEKSNQFTDSYSQSDHRFKYHQDNFSSQQ